VEDIILGAGEDGDFEDFVKSIIAVKNIGDPESVSFEELEDLKETIANGMDDDQIRHAVTHAITFNVLKTKHDRKPRIVSYTTTPEHTLLSARIHLCTPRGVVVMGADSVAHQSRVLSYAYEKLGLKVLMEVPPPLRFCDEDYIPAGPGLTLMGTGVKTDEAAVRYLLEADVFGTDRVAVVKNLFERDESTGTLERISKIVDVSCIAILASVLGRDNVNRRLVCEYVRSPRDGKYHLSQMDVEFGSYMESLGYTVIKLPAEVHARTGSTGLVNLGLGQLLTTEPKLQAIFSECAAFTGHVHLMDTDSTSPRALFDFMASSSLPIRASHPGSHLILPPITAHPEPVFKPYMGADRKQCARAALMVLPIGFRSNPETAADNQFMKKSNKTPEEIEYQALKEFSRLHLALTDAGVQIVLFSSETYHNTPDSVYPNNWFSTHPAAEMASGESTVCFYPMATPSRRAERRQNIVSYLQSLYRREISFVQWENSDLSSFLESTGVLILDRVSKIAYATLSQRCHEQIARNWAQRLSYELVLFNATDLYNRPIYHTNVMMAVGTSFVIICLESIQDEEEREAVRSKLAASGKEIITITRDQVANFCGNVLELEGADNKKILAMSSRAYAAFTSRQLAKIKTHVDSIVRADVETIENIGGGGVRCMLGELY
jgi:hypothetical protein